MKTEDKIQVEVNGNELTIKRAFDAPKDLVFETFTNCEHLKHWWGPKEWPMKECNMDFKEGGTWHFCLRGPNAGDESWGLAVFQEIKRPDKIVWTDHFSDKDGTINEDMPPSLNTAEFVEENGMTTIISRSKYKKKSDLDTVMEMGMIDGFTSTQDRLEEYLQRLQEE